MPQIGRDKIQAFTRWGEHFRKSSKKIHMLSGSKSRIHQWKSGSYDIHWNCFCLEAQSEVKNKVWQTPCQDEKFFAHSWSVTHNVKLVSCLCFVMSRVKLFVGLFSWWYWQLEERIAGSRGLIVGFHTKNIRLLAKATGRKGVCILFCIQQGD